MLSIYITLYDIGDSRFHHWALAATETVSLTLTEPVHLYQIITHAFGPEQEGNANIEDGLYGKARRRYPSRNRYPHLSHPLTASPIRQYG